MSERIECPHCRHDIEVYLDVRPVEQPFEEGMYRCNNRGAIHPCNSLCASRNDGSPVESGVTDLLTELESLRAEQIAARNHYDNLWRDLCGRESNSRASALTSSNRADGQAAGFDRAIELVLSYLATPPKTEGRQE